MVFGNFANVFVKKIMIYMHYMLKFQIFMMFIISNYKVWFHILMGEWFTLTFSVP